MEAHVEINQKFQKKISENFEDFKNTISSSFEEHVMKTSLELASQKNDSELFEIQVSNELDQFEADISGIVKAAGDQTSSSVAKLLDTITNSTENVNECIADIGAIKGDINDITSDTEREKKAASELRKLFDESTAKVNKIFNFVAKISESKSSYKELDQNICVIADLYSVQSCKVITVTASSSKLHL